MNGFQQNLKNRMRSTTFCIHRCLPDESILLTSFHELETIDIVCDSIFCKSLHKDSIDLRLMEIQSFGFGKILKEIIDFLIIDLKERTIDSKLGFIPFMCIDLLEEFIDGSWNESSKILIR